MRFAPTVEEMREHVRVANQRAENLAWRITQARRAIRSGQSPELVMAILDGKAEPPQFPCEVDEEWWQRHLRNVGAKP